MDFFNSLYFKISLIAIYISTILVICRYVKKDSYYDLDIVFYTACAIEGNSLSQKQVHEQAYAIARKELGDHRFALLTDSTKFYRNSVYKSSDYFNYQLPFYRIKPFYVYLLSAGYKFGISPVSFSTYVNLCSYSLIAIILLFYLINILNFMKGYLVSFCIMLMPFMLDTAKSNTPDLLGTLLILVAFLLFISSNYRYLSILVFCLLILTRPESIIFITILCCMCLVFKVPEYSTKPVLLLLAFTLLYYGLIVILYKEYSWPLMYKNGFIGLIPDLKHADSTLTIKQYFLGLRFFFNSLFYSEFFLMLLLLIYPLLNLKKSKNIFFIITYSLLCSICIRILFAPDLATRFYSGCLLLAFILFFNFLNHPDFESMDIRKIAE